MKRKCMAALLCFVLMFGLMGCSQQKADFTISKSGKITLSMQTIVNVNEYVKMANEEYQKQGLSQRVTLEEALKMFREQKDVTVTGKDGVYYAQTKLETSQNMSVAKFYQSEGVTTDASEQIWETGMYQSTNEMKKELKASFSAGTEKDLDKIAHITLSFTFPYPVIKVDSLGKIDANNNCRVVWDCKPSEFLKQKAIYAYCQSDIGVTGIKQGQVTGKTVKLTYSGVKTIQVNGKNRAQARFDKTGKYNVKLVAASGEQRTVYFEIDKKKPTVSGVKNGKKYSKTVSIRFKDANGIKSVKLNGKTITNGKKIIKKGKYTLVVKDKVGNVTKVKFRRL